MVKLPSFEDLKKAGASLVESAKSGKLVDQIKSQIESVGEKLTKEGAEMPQGDNPIQTQFQNLQITMRQILKSQSEQAELIDKFQTQLNVLEKVLNKPAEKKQEVPKPTVVNVEPEAVKPVDTHVETTHVKAETKTKKPENKE